MKWQTAQVEFLFVDHFLGSCIANWSLQKEITESFLGMESTEIV